MNLTENYLSENGYDYYGNAAEDTLLFFVRDEDSPSGEASAERSTEAITNLSNETVNGVTGNQSVESTSANAEAGVQAYSESNGDNSANFDIEQTKASSGNEYSDAPVLGSMSAPDDNREGDGISRNIPHFAPIDEKQTDVQQSRFKN